MARKHVQRWSVATAFLTVTVYFVFYEHHGQLPSVHRHRWLGGRKGIQPVKRWGDGGGGHWLVRMEWRPAGLSVSASVNLPLHRKVQKFSSGIDSPGWSRKKGRSCDGVVLIDNDAHTISLYFYRLGALADAQSTGSKH